MLAHWYGIFGASPTPKQETRGAIYLRAQFKGVETEEQKQLRREAQGIIQRIQDAPKPTPKQIESFRDDAEGISTRLQDAITELLNRQAIYYAEAQAQQEAEEHATQQARVLNLLLIEAQLQASIMQQQIDELDAVFVMFMLAAHA